MPLYDSDSGRVASKPPAPAHEVTHSNSVGMEYPHSNLQLEKHPIDQGRSLKVAVIGAGMAGVSAGVLLPVKVPGIDLKIYEKNSDVGGTWLENIYPGVRCDIPANVYQTTFSPNTQWTEEFAQGEEILEYWQRIAKKYDVHRYLHLGQRIERIEWDEKESVWDLTIKNLETTNVYREKADFVITVTGRFNAWQLPDYPGMKDYQGLLRHSSDWDPEFDAIGKNVAVIGNGASGIQLVPSLQKVVNRLDHYAQSFKDPSEYLRFRKELEQKYWRRFGTQFKGSKLNEGLREDFIKVMASRLQKKPDLLQHMVPDFSPHCRRLTPGPCYLESLCCDNVDLIREHIKRFTAHGIETVDGKVRDVDAVFCATGANVNFAPPYSIVARGTDLSTAWRPDGKFGFPYTYLGLATPGFPNLLFVGGPHGSAAAGTITHSIENQLTYCAKLLRKVSSQGIKSIAPSAKAADDFLDSAHANVVRREPRWEDWEYEYLSSSGNRFAYFGDGWTKKELDPEADLTTYLKLPEEVDLRSLHESWLEF
ncbi:hypothetical protein MMC22_007395 [Lobaria immixta]|nr:hypothetical protein [Lobaria immixta]